MGNDLQLFVTSLLVAAAINVPAENLPMAAGSGLPLPFAGVANMGFADEREGDGIGGWSDQGPSNDFRAFDRTRPRYGGVPFTIVAPGANAGKAVVTMGCRRFPNGPAQVVIELPQPRTARWLYLLHTTCWNDVPADGTVGTITIAGTDGSTATAKVVNGTDVADWWTPQNLPNGILGGLVANGESSVGVYVSRFPTGLDVPIRSLTVSGNPKGGTVWILVAATLADEVFTPEPADVAQRWTATADARWRPVDLKHTCIQPGSALDFSRLVPAGIPGQLTIAADGGLRDGDRPVRLWGASIDLTLLTKRFALARDMTKVPWPSDAELAAYAEAIRIQGYNLVRLGTHDHLLTIWAEKTGEFDPRAVEVIDRFVHQLRQRGIRVYVDLMGSTSGYTAGNPWAAERQALDFKRGIFTDPAIRRNWQEGVRAFLTRRNPYTGTSLAEDPMVVAVLPYNEQDIPLGDAARIAKLPAAWGEPWRAWLSRTYADPAALAAAWGITAPVGGFAEIALPDLTQLRSGQRANDMIRFLADAHRDLLAWYRQEVTALGCGAPVTQYDAIPSLFFHALRGETDAISMHAYHAHPTEWANPGSRTAQASAVTGLGPYLRLMAATRQFGKPFLVTEYGHVFWNRYRHEEGLLAGAIAAHQGWEAMMAHQLPVGDVAEPAYALADGSIDRASLTWEHPLDKAPIKPFWIGPDPVARASQALTTLAYADAAVASSPHRIEIVVDPAATVAAKTWADGIPGEQRNLALVSGLGVRVGTLADRPGIDLQLPLAGTARIVATDAAAGMADDPGDPRRAIDDMRARGLIPADNATDPAQGIYESDTGELRIERDRMLYTVRTPRLEGATLGHETAATIDALTVHRVSVPGSVAAASLDGKPLRDSRRILLIYATDALNTGMTFTAPDRVELVDSGHAPVLIEAGAISATLATRQEGLHAWALGFDGARRQELPLVKVDNGVRLDVDMATLPEPSFFIELAVP
jgi:hypothetical protein